MIGTLTATGKSDYRTLEDEGRSISTLNRFRTLLKDTNRTSTGPGVLDEDIEQLSSSFQDIEMSYHPEPSLLGLLFTSRFYSCGSPDTSSCMYCT